MAKTLYSKLDSASDVTNPTIGTGGAEVGSPTYVPSYLHNGILSDVDNEGCTFPTAPNNINLDKGSIRFHAKLNFDQTDLDYHYLLDFYVAGNGGIRFYFSPVLHNFTLEAWEGGVKRQAATTSAMSWSIGDIIRFDLQWDREGTDIRSNETLAIFMDTVLVASSIFTWNTDTVNSNLYIGTDKDGNNHSDAVIDELKLFDYCIFIANYWKEVAARLDSALSVYDLCLYNAKLYGTYDGTNTKLVEWNDVDAWVKRVAAGEVLSLIRFDGKLYGGAKDLGKIYYWNDVDAWIEDADLGSFSIYEFVEYHGKLYCGTSIGSAEGGCLWRRNSLGNWTQVAPGYDTFSQYIHSLCVHNDKIYAGSGHYGKLLEWNGENAWTVVADANAQGLGNVYIEDLLSYEDLQWNGVAFVKVQRLLAVGSGIGTGFLWEWNGVDEWTVLITGHPAIGEMHDLLLYEGDKVLGISHSDPPRCLLVMWNKGSSWLPLTTNHFDFWMDTIEILNGKVYGGSYNFGKLGEWISDAPNKPTNLLCCNKASSGYGGLCSPVLIDTYTPYFSAIFTDPGEEDIATHYQLQVNTAPDMSGTYLWNSGKISMTNISNGERCGNITYGGLALERYVTYYWRILFYDQDGIPGLWSEINCFRMVEEAPIPPERENPVNAVGKVKKARLPLLTYRRELIWSRLLTPPARVILDP